MTSLDTKFKGNTTITEFMELNKFGVTNIGQNAFSNCTNLEAIDLSNIVTLSNNKSEPQYGVFLNCNSLKNVGDISGIESLGCNAFYGCSSLAIDINLPNLTTINTGVFNGSGIVSVTSLGNITRLTGSEIG